MPWIGFVFLMGHMSVSHIYRHWVNDPSVIDVTGAQMVLVMKLTAFCWNVHDGRLPQAELTDHQRDRAIVGGLPSFLDYAAYVLFFPSLFAGPAFDYVDYKRWINTDMFDLPAGTDPTKAPPTRKKRKIPRSGTPAMMKLFAGLIWILGFLKMSGIYYPHVVLEPSYLKYSLPRRILILILMTFTVRMKYYGVWALTEGACILTGIGYKGLNPKTGAADWTRLQNVNPIGIELAQNTRAFLGNWNMNTNNWLRNYMYLRVTPKGKKPGFRASLATFTTSAFWHGFEPGYYMAFILASFLQTSAKHARRLFRPFFLTPDGTKPLPRKRWYDVASWFVTQTVFAFTTAPFILLTASACWECWTRVYFYGIALALGSLAFFNSPARGLLSARVKSYTGQKRPGIQRWESTDSVKAPHLGLPDDPQKDVEEAFEEARREIEARFGGDGSAEGKTAEVQQAVKEKAQQILRQKSDIDVKKLT
ncbi:hypothetical protein FH972_023593 [Carpinus fangiana]|uniref:Uncharacterized protein n=1 Tax=Carpinus fangiana TaxID=176857 RepID=A0A5N6KW47_9ROSI|nr:hypothetical protein FH972_023593 [Carpinus fangiana]